ncbi:glycoside hydrolase family 88 protein [Myxococcus stipitatus]|uniref:glycoside hydrolase family 88 protein n=1 Tax=Myxococcus stipitatus TaxID=83455 RepID=UPI002278D7F4|nr:glycoside hydrolase family 88 protein [Myxococcus stipitatus]
MRLPRMGGMGVCLSLMLVGTSVHAFDDADAVRVVGFARTQMRKTAAALPSTTRSPKASRADGTWSTVANTDAVGWTQGFFPGLMWNLFQVGLEPSWQRRADQWTRPLEVQKTNRQTHDLGFKMFLSFGNAYRLTRDPYYRGVLLTSAASLATRYNSRVGVIDCCDWNSAWDVPIVTDTMMNLELLLWASQNGGRAEWRSMAINHALRTLQDAVRPDGSSFHYVDYNGTTGAIRSRGTFQGFSTNSTWARGHAWLMYGYTMVYRYTGDTRMLAAARKVTDWYLAHVPSDMVPKWDFDAPGDQRDSSAAAVVASALLELSALETDAARKTRYRDAALRTLDTLMTSTYFAEGTNSPGLLLHGVGNLPAKQEVDVSLIYGDYYFLEAVLRFNPNPPYPWYSKRDFFESQHLLGTTNTGVRTVEFDITPLASSQDATVGYSDSSTAVTGYSVLSMTVRMNADGYFDVRNGGGYAALTRVRYVQGQTYHVRLVADLPARRYSVWVRPPGGSEVQIANRYAFRTGAPFIDDLGRVSVRTVLMDGDFRVLGHRVTAGGSTIASDAPERSAMVLSQSDAPSEALLATLARMEQGALPPTEDSTRPAPEWSGSDDGTSMSLPEDASAGVNVTAPDVAETAGCGSTGAECVPAALLALWGWTRRRSTRR